jgi:hypothetical protein
MWMNHAKNEGFFPSITFYADCTCTSTLEAVLGGPSVKVLSTQPFPCQGEESTHVLHVVFSLNLLFISLAFSLILCLLASEQELYSSVIMLHGGGVQS